MRQITVSLSFEHSDGELSLLFAMGLCKSQTLYAEVWLF